MNRFAAGIRVALIIIATVVSVGAFAETQCPGGTAPPCEPIVVTDSRDPVATCEETGTCGDLAPPLLLADGRFVQTGPIGSSAQVWVSFFKNTAALCKKASESCARWFDRATIHCDQIPTSSVRYIACQTTANNQYGNDCPNVTYPAG